MLRVNDFLHPAVPHPDKFLKEPDSNHTDAVIDWLTVHLGASVVVFWIAFTVPLAVLPLSNTVKLIVAVISGSWYQWWMLTGIQRSVAKADAAGSAKKEADHQALTSVHLAVDEIHAMTQEIRDAVTARGNKTLMPRTVSSPLPRPGESK